MTLFEALTGGAFDRLNWNIAGNLTKIFQKSQMPGGLPGGGGMGGFGIDRYIMVEIDETEDENDDWPKVTENQTNHVVAA